MSSLMESICSLESELWVRRLVSVLGTLILTAANVAFMVKKPSSFYHVKAEVTRNAVFYDSVFYSVFSVLIE